MADILSTVSIVSFVLAGLLFVLAIVLLIVFKIPTVIGDLSGRNAKKALERMRQSNEKNGGKSYIASSVNLDRGKISEASSNNKESGASKVNVVKPAPKPSPDATTALSEGMPTELLGGDEQASMETMPLYGTSGETLPLKDDFDPDGATTQLNRNMINDPQSKPMEEDDFDPDGATRPLSINDLNGGSAMPSYTDSNSGNETEPLYSNVGNETEPLNEYLADSGTMPLYAEGQTGSLEGPETSFLDGNNSKRIEIIDEVMLIHTSEVIA